MKDISRSAGGGATASRAVAAGQPVTAELLGAISIIRRSVRRGVRQAWTQDPLPRAQSELLRLAARQPGLTVAEAARELRLAPNTVSTLVSRLAGQGMLRRDRAAADGRTALLTVTDTAARRLAEWRDLRAELAAKALEQLPAADQDAIAAAGTAIAASRMAGWSRPTRAT